MQTPSVKEQLINRGIRLPNPESVTIGQDVDIHRISDSGVVIHGGCKIFGSSTCICAGSEIGREAPVTLENCYIGPGVQLKGGYFKNAVFLKGASAGSGAHVREGTILEESASIAHTVGLKQTVLFPFVTLGSLINFCDCLMAGGTDRKNHSEVGSSYIHFNYTPHQDKATPSLIGDVPKGVMLNQSPIFLGGQGGLVGPVRLAFGTVIAAGTIYRKDELRPGRLIFGGSPKEGNIAYRGSTFRGLRRIVANNLIYIANLVALEQWYTHVRSQFISENFPVMLLEGLKKTLQAAVNERISRLKQLSDQVPESELCRKWAKLETCLRIPPESEGIDAKRDQWIQILEKVMTESDSKDYIQTIRSLAPASAKIGTAWLQLLVDKFLEQSFAVVPSFSKE